MTHLLAPACALFVLGLLAGEARQHFALRLVTKSTASLLFCAYALALGALDRGAPGLWVVAALVLSLVGDVALLWRSKRLFLGGLVAFLLGHVCFGGAFLALGVAWPAVLAAGLPLAALALGVWRWLAPHVGALGPAVLAYVVVITSMVALAAGSAVDDPSPARLGLLGAATLFFLSDLCVARDRFIAPGLDNRLVGLPTYYAAQLLFALAIAAV